MPGVIQTTTKPQALPNALHELINWYRDDGTTTEREFEEGHLGLCPERRCRNTCLPDLLGFLLKHHSVLGHQIHPTHRHFHRHEHRTSGRNRHGLPHPQGGDSEV